MEWFRVARNPWGQEVILGLSFDLVWVFLGTGAAFIAAHALYAAWRARRVGRRADGVDG